MQEAAYKVGTIVMHLLVMALATEPAGKIEVKSSSTELLHWSAHQAGVNWRPPLLKYGLETSRQNICNAQMS